MNTTNEVLAAARKNLGGQMESSALLCLEDAEAYAESGNWTMARKCASRSLKYSVGIFHADYQGSL